MPVHWVEFPRGFWIARTEVTNAQYEVFDPEHERTAFSPGDEYPAVQVSWKDVTRYCDWLGERSGRDLRLPSESEWECACRAGSSHEFCGGDDEQRLGEYARFSVNSNRRLHAVGTRRANAWGLSDLHGNVWEWCEDTYQASYVGAPRDGTARTVPVSPYRVFRGGSFGEKAANCRSAIRDGSIPDFRDIVLGFRPAFAVPEGAAPSAP